MGRGGLPECWSDHHDRFVCWADSRNIDPDAIIYGLRLMFSELRNVSLPLSNPSLLLIPLSLFSLAVYIVKNASCRAEFTFSQCVLEEEVIYDRILIIDQLGNTHFRSGAHEEFEAMEVREVAKAAEEARRAAEEVSALYCSPFTFIA